MLRHAPARLRARASAGGLDLVRFEQPAAARAATALRRRRHARAGGAAAQRGARALARHALAEFQEPFAQREALASRSCTCLHRGPRSPPTSTRPARRPRGRARAAGRAASAARGPAGAAAARALPLRAAGGGARRLPALPRPAGGRARARALAAPEELERRILRHDQTLDSQPMPAPRHATRRPVRTRTATSRSPTR